MPLWMFFLLLSSFCFLHFNGVADGLVRRKSSKYFNVKHYGAAGNGKRDDSRALAAAWTAACRWRGSAATVLIPGGTYLIGPVKFHGPCKRVQSLTFNIKGYLKASTDIKKYRNSSDWVEFGRVDGLNVIGGGTFDGQGAASWHLNKCPTHADCILLPTSLKFISMNKTVVRDITSLNSKFFHIALVDCNHFEGSGINISAPSDSPNTDGIHMERCSDVTINQTTIGTGDDCISIGQGNSQVVITGVTCGPGHGISVGSLGKYPNEGDVTGVAVIDSTIFNTTNGLRIKTWSNSPGSSIASNMTFENIVINNVDNPIIIDQAYCPYTSCASKTPSRVQISDITFKNITGTSSSKVAVSLECSKGTPCQNIDLEDVHLDYAQPGALTEATCVNVRAKYRGTQIPPPCG